MLILNAADARSLSGGNYRHHVDAFSAIVQAAMSGKTSMRYYGNLDGDMIADLRGLGYEVSAIYAENTGNQLFTEISWAEEEANDTDPRKYELSKLAEALDTASQAVKALMK